MSKLAQAPVATANWVDDRFHPAGFLRRTFNKVYPDHWSFMLGEIALYSFVILILTGTYLTLFFNPSQQEVIYQGSYVPLRGIEMTQAYQSTLNISFDVRGGLIMRQIHHWAALLFLAAIVVHMMRIFFTGAFRKPREINWLIGVTLFVLAFLEGFAGYSLPDDLLSGTGLRIASSILLSIPVVGTWASFLIFGGEFPGELILGRLYIAHVLLIPGILLALIAAHLAIVVHQKHTQFPGPGKTENNVVGVRQFPLFALKGGGFFMLVFAVTAALGGLAQINPIWLYGPYSTGIVSAGSQPDWYVGFLDGSSRLFPDWEIRTAGITVPPIFWPAVVLPGVLFTLLALYPFLEARFTKDREHHNLLQRPRDTPTRTALGAMALSFYSVLLLSGGNDVLALKFDISLNATTWMGRIGLIIVPPIAYYITHRICLGLQQHDREILAHGVETGIVRRLPSGEFIEVHQPLGEVDEHGHPVPIEYAQTPVPRRLNQLGVAGRSVKGFFTPIVEPAPGGSDSDSADLGTQPERRELTGVDD
ncbi:MAG: ubiquinol-cytochrome c reductase cytochrome b subunit [Mycobacteriales bacterium]